MAWCVFLAVTAGASWPLVRVMLSSLPDFRTHGDGGVGMAHNAVAAVAAVLLTPVVVGTVFASLLHLLAMQLKSS